MARWLLVVVVTRIDEALAVRALDEARKRGRVVAARRSGGSAGSRGLNSGWR